MLSSASIAAASWAPPAALRGMMPVARSTPLAMAEVEGEAAVMDLEALDELMDDAQQAAEPGPAPAPAPEPVPAVSGGFAASEEPYPMEALRAMDGWGAETGGGGPWDPLELAGPRFELFGSTEAKLAWYRQAEIKHGRVAMAACVGWIVSGSGVAFPGALTKGGLTFAGALGANPLETWANVPDDGKLQLLALAFVLESWTEVTAKPHYMNGGKAGDVQVPLGWDPLRLTRTFKKPNTYKGKQRTTEELVKTSRDAELRNGRLAMVGIAGFYASAVVPGSVPWAPVFAELFKGSAA